MTVFSPIHREWGFHLEFPSTLFKFYIPERGKLAIYVGKIYMKTFCIKYREIKNSFHDRKEENYRGSKDCSQSRKVCHFQVLDNP